MGVCNVLCDLPMIGRLRLSVSINIFGGRPSIPGIRCDQLASMHEYFHGAEAAHSGHFGGRTSDLCGEPC